MSVQIIDFLVGADFTGVRYNHSHTAQEGQMIKRIFGYGIFIGFLVVGFFYYQKGMAWSTAIHTLSEEIDSYYKDFRVRAAREALELATPYISSGVLGHYESEIEFVSNYRPKGPFSYDESAGRLESVIFQLAAHDVEDWVEQQVRTTNPDGEYEVLIQKRRELAKTTTQEQIFNINQQIGRMLSLKYYEKEDKAPHREEDLAAYRRKFEAEKAKSETLLANHGKRLPEP